MGANAQTSVPAFTSGQVLTAAQVTQINTGIPVFASSTERDAAFGGSGEKTLAEGQMAYLEDTNATQYYDGSSWAAIAGGGKILQVVSTTKTDTFTTSSATFVDVTGFSASITPSSASNTILVAASYAISNDSNTTASAALARLLRDSTAIYVGDTAGNRVPSSGYHGNEALFRMVTHVTNTLVDSPATTSAVTYKLQLRRGGGGNAVFNRSGEDFDGTAVARLASSITLLEVSA